MNKGKWTLWISGATGITLTALVLLSLPKNDPYLFSQSAAPDEMRREVERIDKLAAESLEDSLQNLSDMEGFHSQVHIDFYGDNDSRRQLPLLARQGNQVNKNLMSNRRVVKLYQDLATLDKAVAGEVVADRLQYVLDEYKNEV